jgi:hypothetical protein
MAVRMRELRGVALLAAICLADSSCSISTVRQSVDVTGCGSIKWGMTMEQVKTLLGPKARIETDPLGKKFETVTMRIGNVELTGVVTTELHSERVNGVGLFEQDGRPLKEPMFKTLKLLVTKEFGAPLKEYSLASSKTCRWEFPSGTILLTSYYGVGQVTLHYMQSPSIINYQIPLQN